jgi:hypothetical protein
LSDLTPDRSATADPSTFAPGEVLRLRRIIKKYKLICHTLTLAFAGVLGVIFLGGNRDDPTTVAATTTALIIIPILYCFSAARCNRAARKLNPVQPAPQKQDPRVNTSSDDPYAFVPTGKYTTNIASEPDEQTELEDDHRGRYSSI